VLDIVAGVIMVAQRGSGDGYKLASDDDLSILDVVHLFGRKTTHIIVPERRGERFQSICGPSRARAELGWAPKVRLECYLRDVVEQYE
jgi:UDP-glucose 4-epimerase